MENFYFVGVDVSKKKLDFCVLSSGKVVHEEVIANDVGSVSVFLIRLQSDLCADSSRFLICCEHTGQYTYPLICGCQSLSFRLWVENPAQIKYSSGVSRGKNDKIDAKRIALYGCRFADKVQPYERPSEEIEHLKQLESERALYVTDLGKYKAQVKDQRDYMPCSIYKLKLKRLMGLIQELEGAIKAINDQIRQIIDNSAILSRQFQLLVSVEGVGPVVATNMIIATAAFTRFDDPRKFNCYAGLAPFSYTSGSSQHSRARVSHRADKSIKKLLHLAAVAVTHKTGGELKRYYERKVAEGKNKMLVINALRAKIVARMFAVIKKNDFYQPFFSA